MGSVRRLPSTTGPGKAPTTETRATPLAISGHLSPYPTELLALWRAAMKSGRGRLQRVEESMPKHNYDINYTPRMELAEKAKTMCWDEVADLMAVVERMARLNMSEPQIRRCVQPVAQEAMDSLRAMLLDEGDR